MEEIYKKNRKRNILLMTIFALCGVVMEAAMARAFVYGLLIESLVHAGVYIVFFGLFSAFAKKIVALRLTKKACLIVTVFYCTGHIVMTLFLVKNKPKWEREVKDTNGKRRYVILEPDE